MVLIPSVELCDFSGCYDSCSKFGGEAYGCTVVVVPPIGDQAGVLAAAEIIRPRVGSSIVFIYLGAPSTASPFSPSSSTSSPFDSEWWSAVGLQHEHLCKVLCLDIVKTPYIIELFVGTSRKFSIPHFKFVQDALASQFRFKVEYNKFVYSFQTNMKCIRDMVVREHDCIFGLPTYTRAFDRLSHFEHVSCLGFLFWISLLNYVNTFCTDPNA